ncbi:hypothetical protein L1987_33552 [Smallanthus sonchifolius]|uniref:Uncharacterized protein n=1 Tax=Smallanthus sonchifolius TaxID=185202 RepID=A0ACB9HST1_9ASTR|nr:hypothetical protein L1987_33552 [Smallanthus sonchifolius]
MLVLNLLFIVYGGVPKVLDSGLMNKFCSAGKVTYDDIDRVKDLIERCIVNYMEKEEVVDVLYQHHNIEPCFTRIVWQQLEEQNKEFFRDYYLRLAVKDQKLNPNEVDAVPPMNFDRGASSSSLEIISFRLKEEMRMVKNLIEQCLLDYMRKEQVMDILYQKENIGYAFTKTAWEHLEQQNQEYFKNYYLSRTGTGYQLTSNRDFGTSVAGSNRHHSSSAFCTSSHRQPAVWLRLTAGLITLVINSKSCK